MNPTKRDALFAKHDSDSNLAKRSLQGGALAAASQAINFTLRFGATAVLARVLSPRDYGLVAMSAVVVGLAGVFKDAGLTTATIQREEINHQQISTLFWINVILGAAICAMVALSSGLVASFYGAHELRDITIALSATFALSGLTVQHQALLRRQMRFRALSVIQIASGALGAFTAIVMAVNGLGYWSLVGMPLAIATGQLAGSWIALRWIPSLPRKAEGVGKMLNFGTDVLVFQVINYFARQSDNLLIGWKWGPTAVGLYEKAYSLLLMPVSQINTPLASVVVPALSKSRSDPQEYKRILMGALELIFSLTIPLLFFLAILSEQVVALWLGEDWLECASIFRYLLPAAVIGTILNTTGWTLLSQGNTKLFRTMGIVNSVIIVSCIAIGLAHGVAGVAVAYSLAMLLVFLPTWHLSLRGTGIAIGAVLPSFYRPVLACLPGGALAWLIAGSSEFGSSDYWLKFVLASFTYLLCYALISLLAMGKWKDLVALKRIIAAKKA